MKKMRDELIRKMKAAISSFNFPQLSSETRVKHWSWNDLSWLSLKWKRRSWICLAFEVLEVRAVLNRPCALNESASSRLYFLILQSASPHDYCSLALMASPWLISAPLLCMPLALQWESDPYMQPPSSVSLSAYPKLSGVVMENATSCPYSIWY